MNAISAPVFLLVCSNTARHECLYMGEADAWVRRVKDLVPIEDAVDAAVFSATTSIENSPLDAAYRISRIRGSSLDTRKKTRGTKKRGRKRLPRIGHLLRA
ncbi:hypothetical protein XA68_10516 [Ophiocordyceps unilateralis]|uniref:Uncharacterized protein n=1 Tax=Ophiocordyceps unilateralis TaxID=268505 RepID=A0A2A9P2S5_OPHUN|nr:hypothetical protein XA68_10516 [Ophiocordyceps unilateralis]